MYNIQYLYTASVEMVFDDMFSINDVTESLDELVSYAEKQMANYNFKTVEMIDNTTGELLVTINRG